MSLQAVQKPISELINNKCFIIPSNQRRYVWDKNNWLELMEDIILVWKTNKDKKHFIGSIVLKSEEKKNDIIFYTIIDGQQRITTITITLCAIAYIYAKYNDINRFKALKKYLFTTNNKNEDIPLLSKEQANADIDILVNFLYTDILNLLENNKEIDDLKNYLKNYKISQNVKECVSYFYEQFENVIDDNLDKLEQICSIILEMNYVDIVADSDEDAYSIFEILNARGLPLTDIELLRNFMLKYSPSNQHSYVIETMNSITTLLDKYVNTFLDHYVTHKYGDKTNKKENRSYKCISKNEKNNDIRILLEDLNLKSKYYDKLVSLNNCDNIESKIFGFFKSRKQQQFRPLILGLMHQKDLGNLSTNDYHKSLEYLYAFFVCYNVIGKETSNKIDEVIKKYSQIVECNFSLNVIENLKKSIIKRLPTKEHILNSIKNLKYSNHIEAYKGSKNAGNVRAILELYEMSLNSDFEFGKEEFNIEHCYPDSLHTNESTYTVGNMILIEKTINDECEAKDLYLKRELYKTSQLKAPLELCELLDDDSNFNIEDRLSHISETIYEYIIKLSNGNIANN